MAAPPYASFYTEGRLFRKAAQGDAAFYHQLNISPTSSEAAPPDHIVYELEFISFFCSLEQAAWKKGDTEKVSELEKIERAFYKEHFFTWIIQFCDCLFESSQLVFYQILALFTRGFIHEERFKHAKTS